MAEREENDAQRTPYSERGECLHSWTPLPERWLQMADAHPDSILLQTSRFDASNQYSYLFLNAVRTLSAWTLDAVPDLFRDVEAALAAGLYAAGYVSYECGYHFEQERFPLEQVLNVDRAAQGLPLAWFGIYRDPMIFDHATGLVEGNFDAPGIESAAETPPILFAENATLETSEAEYCAKIRRIQEYIRAGDTYQVNFTDRITVPTHLSAATAYATLLRHQSVAYGAFLNVAGQHILSFSPELFFKIDQGKIITRPMKGTLPRGRDAAEDAQAAIRLQQDEKNRSEHVMIVDLLRNDLGRICTAGSVQVEDIFSIETYETLLQMTSTISGTLQPGLAYYDIFKALFPSGSITGAPKIRTMQIIRELENSPRGIYTGAIGFLWPKGSATFNVAIRTLAMQKGAACMGVGGGIIADSNAQEEYRECLLKASFLVRSKPEFQLLETMLWNGAFPFLNLHLDRLESSASYFAFSLDRAAITAQLWEQSKRFPPETRYRVRLLLDAAGKVTIAASQLAPDIWKGRVLLSAERTSSQDVFLHHKTTHRAFYEQHYARAIAAGYDEVIFLNEKDEVTEGAISNLFIKREGKLLTPRLGSGALSGVFRRHLLESDATAEECDLTVEDLISADAVLLCNAVRGLRPVEVLCFGAAFGLPDVVYPPASAVSRITAQAPSQR